MQVASKIKVVSPVQLDVKPVVDAVGYYKLRNGGRAHIYEFFDCAAVGQIERLFQGKPRFRGIDSWDIQTGRRLHHKECPFDIIGKE